MTLTQLEYFVEIVGEGNFTKAANKIFVSQPTLSRTVQNLEKELGTILIDREAKDLQLTKDGQVFYDYAKELLGIFSSKTREMMSRLENSDGTLKLGITPTTGAMYFYSAIYAFREKYPEVNLQIEEVTTRQGIEMLMDERLDLTVMINPEEIDGIERLPVVLSEAVLVVPKNHRLGRRRSVSFEEIRDEKILMVGKGYSYNDVVSSKFREAGIEPRFDFESDQWEFILEMVSNGQGISILPKPLVDKFGSLRIHRIHLENPTFEWTLALVRKKGRHMTVPMECFWNICQRKGCGE